MSEINKFFPYHNNKQIIDEIKRFNHVYNNIKKIVSDSVEWIILSDVLSEKLYEAFPWYSRDLVNTFKDHIDSITKESLIEDKINNLLSQKTTFSLMKSNYLSIDRNASEFLKTAKSIWVLDDSVKTSDYLYNRYDWEWKIPSMYNYEENYKDRIWKKLLLTEREIIESWVVELENMIMPYLEMSISHINKVFATIKSDQKDELKSIYFNSIHSQEKRLSFFNLFKIYYKLEKEKRGLLINEDVDNYSQHIRQINIGQYEIQRLFAFSTLFMNRENTLTFQNALEEQDFLISKLAWLWTKERKDKYLTSEIRWDDLLYNYTRIKDLYWLKDKESWKYLFSDVYKQWYKKTELNTFELEWKFRNYDKFKHKINILHVWTRIRKNPFSSTEKILRKWLSSYNEILDHKWFIFVIDSYEKDLENLIKILEYEFWSLKTSWLEETQSMQVAWNSNTNSEYNSMKWILKVNYKWKLIKDFFELLWEILCSKNLKHLLTEFYWIKNKLDSKFDLSSCDWFIDKINDKRLHEIFNDLKEKFWNKKYFMEVEIQIFDKENYIKAEIDQDSPAFHWKYKISQWIETLPIYFPAEVYWKSIRDILWFELGYNSNQLEK